MFQLKQVMRKSLSVAAVFFVLAWTQASVHGPTKFWYRQRRASPMC